MLTFCCMYCGCGCWLEGLKFEIFMCKSEMGTLDSTLVPAVLLEIFHCKEQRASARKTSGFRVPRLSLGWEISIP